MVDDARLLEAARPARRSAHRVVQREGPLVVGPARCSRRSALAAALEAQRPGGAAPRPGRRQHGKLRITRVAIRAQCQLASSPAIATHALRGRGRRARAGPARRARAPAVARLVALATAPAARPCSVPA
ncbi:unnamed protein product [Prorocentrum cordatum]|uniref:Uncharacterized protein n=1 Tax=Prorocentrum cordatum TaxID=2364126 RepID=A0ABN9QTD6_9DINO|nr:unnamed protein product [Polarella glacialis]